MRREEEPAHAREELRHGHFRARVISERGGVRLAFGPPNGLQRPRAEGYYLAVKRRPVRLPAELARSASSPRIE